MAKIRLYPGIWTNVGSIVLSGAGAVTAANAEQVWLQTIGWTGMGFGILLLIWGLRINDKHIWQSWSIRSKTDPEIERIYQLELAKLDAIERAKKTMALKRLVGGVGSGLTDYLDEQQKDRQAEAEVRRLRMIRDAGNPSNEELDRQRKRELIAKGRDIVHRFRVSGEAGFEKYASRDRDYLDIQPHLGDDYQAERIRDADRIVYGPEHDDYRASMLLRELTRLEKEWQL